MRLPPIISSRPETGDIASRRPPRNGGIAGPDRSPRGSTAPIHGPAGIAPSARRRHEPAIGCRPAGPVVGRSVGRCRSGPGRTSDRAAVRDAAITNCVPVEPPTGPVEPSEMPPRSRLASPFPALAHSMSTNSARRLHSSRIMAFRSVFRPNGRRTRRCVRRGGIAFVGLEEHFPDSVPRRQMGSGLPPSRHTWES